MKIFKFFSNQAISPKVSGTLKKLAIKSRKSGQEIRSIWIRVFLCENIRISFLDLNFETFYFENLPLNWRFWLVNR